MFKPKKQKFCDYCNMPVEDCECEECENCGNIPTHCDCEVCEDCNNFVEYCECLMEAMVEPSKASYCVDCGMHSSECECDTDTKEEKKEEPYSCEKCGKDALECICGSSIQKVEDTTKLEVDENSEVIVIEEPPSLATKIWRSFMSLSMFLVVVAILVTGYFAYNMLFKEEEPTSLTVQQKFDLSAELLSMMYNVRDVQDVINNQETIMSRVSPDMYPKFDVSNEDLFLRRYGSFSNSEISIDINNYTKSKADNQIVLNYEIRPVADMPIKRMAIIEFSMDKKVISFLEYTVNEIQ